MFNRQFKLLLSLFLFFFLSFSASYSEIVKKINILGNERVSNETILMFSQLSINETLEVNELNKILKNLYNSSFFQDVKVDFLNNILTITVIEYPIIQKIDFNGIKAKKIRDLILKDLILKSRSSFNDVSLKIDKEKIQSSLQDLGYYFSKIEIFLEDLNDNKVNIVYNIDLGKKSKINRISFIGDKVFKEKKLKSLIVSEEYKLWKIISGKKYLNKNLILLDKRLLKQFYLNKGFYNVEINSSFARIINQDEFELIFNINANQKISFGKLTLELPKDFDDRNFNNLLKLFKKLEGTKYSINKVENILEEIDFITVNDQFESVSASVIEKLVDNKINLKFMIEEVEKRFVEKINIYGNNITRENVIRNQFEIDEGDPFNEILANKTVNNIKSLNFFKNVNSEIIDGSDQNTKIININVQEKPTGEISAGAGIGTSGGTVSLSLKENNYLGKGIAVNSSITINKESLKGILSATNPNYKNSDKSIYGSIQASEIDRLTAFGYKTNKTGFSFGTNFEYLKDFSLGLGSSNFYEKIETDSTASVRQKAQTGNYWDSFVNLNFDYDKRNQKYQTTDGFRSRYFLDLPIISDTSTISNTYDYKLFSELYENNISAFSFYVATANSLTNKDVKLSERIILPSNKLRGFERGKVGPKDGTDFIGGNYATSINLTSTIPQILENSENIDFLIFFDAANVWGVDYDSSIAESNKIRSSIGMAIDWLTPIGPLNFTLSQAISKSDNDVTEVFRFNLGTTF